MTIKEMEEKVTRAKILQTHIEQYKKLLSVLDVDSSLHINIHLTQGARRHEVLIEADNPIINRLMDAIDNEIFGKETELKKLDGEPEEKFFEILVPKGVYSVYRIKAKDTTDAFEKMAKMEEKDRVDSYVCERGFTLADSDFDYYYTANEEKQ